MKEFADRRGENVQRDIGQKNQSLKINIYRERDLSCLILTTFNNVKIIYQMVQIASRSRFQSWRYKFPKYFSFSRYCIIQNSRTLMRLKQLNS